MKLMMLLCFTCGCGFPVATHCDSPVFGRGIDSVLEVDCDTVNMDVETAISADVTLGRTLDSNGEYSVPIDEDVFRSRMKHAYLLIRSVNEWQDGVSGYTSAELNVEVERHGWALSHEMLHVYDIVGIYEQVPGPNQIGEASRESNHVGWTSNGYYEAEGAYLEVYEPFRPLCSLQHPEECD